MPQQVTNIKKRISSIKSAYKVTSAMKLVSTVKLKRWRNSMLENKVYSKEIETLTSKVLSCSDNVSSPFFEINKSANKNLYIIVSSTLGLCGSYNNNILRLADKEIKPQDDLIVLGGKGMAHYVDGNNSIIPGFEETTSITDPKLEKSLLSLIQKKYLDKTYKEIHLIYSTYVNAMVFKASDAIILPIQRSNNSNLISPIIEPSPQQLADILVPIYLKGNLHSKLLESEVCEQASRSNAMENATKNAEELLSALNIEFNKARQGAITQEIIEIVASSQNV